ncbi:MAG TPA: sigma-70 family RNA polymerase sigma factor [Niabella sp.]
MNATKLHIDESVLKSFAEGSAASFTQIYNRLYPDLYFLARKLVQEAAPDVLADVFVEVWTQKKHFESADHLFYYVRSMTRNACFDYLKKEGRNIERISGLLQLNDTEHRDVYFREIVEGHLFSLIRKEIDKLPPHLREVFTLSYIQGLKNSEIAGLLGIKDSSVRVRKAEALKILRAAFYGSDLLLWLLLLMPKNNF